jgi:taurine dioxygenase
MAVSLREATHPNDRQAALDLRPLGPTFAAEIRGLDLSAPLDEPTFRAVEQALLQHKLLVFRGQNLSARAQRDFAARFGDLHVHPINPHIPDVPEIMVLDFDDQNRNDNSTWHTDVSFIETPPLGSVLHAIDLPDVGGDTIFADQAAALAALSAPIRQAIEGLSAVHDFAKSFRPERYTTPEGRARWQKMRETHAPVSHPMVRTHPVTGEKGLFVNEGFTLAIEGLQRHESDALLALLFKHSQQPEFSYRHRWQPGDTLFWDNRITQHYAVIDYWPRHRRMHRAAILGDRPRADSLNRRTEPSPRRGPPGAGE